MSIHLTNKYPTDNLGIGRRLKKARQQKKLSQQNLADFLGLKRNSISNYEHEKSYPSVDILAKIVRILDVSSDYLIGVATESNLAEEPSKKYRTNLPEHDLEAENVALKVRCKALEDALKFIGREKK